MKLIKFVFKDSKPSPYATIIIRHLGPILERNRYGGDRIVIFNVYGVAYEDI